MFSELKLLAGSVDVTSKKHNHADILESLYFMQWWTNLYRYKIQTQAWMSVTIAKYSSLCFLTWRCQRTYIKICRNHAVGHVRTRYLLRTFGHENLCTMSTFTFGLHKVIKKQIVRDDFPERTDKNLTPLV